MIRITIRVLSVIALVLAALWFWRRPDYEPAITFLLGLAGLLGSIFVRKRECPVQQPSPARELPVDRATASELQLEPHLQKDGYRLFWGDTSKREYYLVFGDYEQIPWSDDQGNKRILGPMPGGDLPLRTKYSSQEIEARRRQRAQKGSNN